MIGISDFCFLAGCSTTVSLGLWLWSTKMPKIFDDVIPREFVLATLATFSPRWAFGVFKFLFVRGFLSTVFLTGGKRRRGLFPGKISTLLISARGERFGIAFGSFFISSFESFSSCWAILRPWKYYNKKVVITGKIIFWYWCYCLSIEYYDSVKERLSNPYSSILS